MQRDSTFLNWHLLDSRYFYVAEQSPAGTFLSRCRHLFIRRRRFIPLWAALYLAVGTSLSRCGHLFIRRRRFIPLWAPLYPAVGTSLVLPLSSIATKTNSPSVTLHCSPSASLSIQASIKMRIELVPTERVWA